MSTTQQRLEVALQPLTSEEASEELHDRIEELRHIGLRLRDARRIAELEQSGAEEDELKRAKVSAVFRAEPSIRDRYIGDTVEAVRDREIRPFAALKRLQRFEIASQELTFARYETDARYGKHKLICYEPDGCPAALYEMRDQNQVYWAKEDTNKESLIRHFGRLPE